MSVIVKGLQSEIFVPVTPPPVWAPATKPLKDAVVALAQQQVYILKVIRDLTWQEISHLEKYRVPFMEMSLWYHTVDMITVTLTRILTVCSQSRDYRSLQKKDL